MNAAVQRLGLERWLEGYEAWQRELLRSDPEFATWLEKEYVPLAGGWMY